MKKILLIILVLIVGLYGCGSDSGDNYQKQIDSLKQDLDAYTVVLDNLEQELLALEEERDKLETDVRSLQKEKTTLNNKISDLEEKIAELQETITNVQLSTNGVGIYLAKRYYLVPGDNFQLFYRSIIQAVNPYNYYIKLTGEYGHAYNRYYEWTPEKEHAGNMYPLQIDVCDNLGNVLVTATTNLIVTSVAKEENVTKNVLCIGDSLTYNGYWVSYGAEKYKAAGGTTLNFIGTTTGGYADKTYKYEGNSGWQWSSYLSASSPFYSTSAKGINFKDYCTKNGFTGIDEVYILMTWNGIGGRFRTFNMDSEPFLSAKKFIDKLHEDYPDAKITLMGIPQPSVNSGLGAYYEIDLSYGDNYGQFVTALNYNKQLEEFSRMDEYKSFVRFVDVKGQFDSEYNMPTVAKSVNNQSSTTENIGSSMGMHPTTGGYLQIGDAFYRALVRPWIS